MSESQSKMVRRDLRRVLGQEAEQALRSQAEAVGFMSDAVRRHQADIQASHLDVGELRIASLDPAHRIDLCESLQDRDLRGRLTWLLLGR